jgi:hypothetical protein
MLTICVAAITDTRGEAASPEKDVARLYPARMSVCWHDADRIDELALNARGKLTFFYIDAKLGSALQRLREDQSESGPSSAIPKSVFAYASKYNAKKRHVLFVARVQAPKLWTFDSGKISAGGYSPKESDIITGASSNPYTELRSGARELDRGYDGFIGFFVPAEHVKPGSEIKIGYDTDMTDWKVPSKNE